MAIHANSTVVPVVHPGLLRRGATRGPTEPLLSGHVNYPENSGVAPNQPAMDRLVGRDGLLPSACTKVVKRRRPKPGDALPPHIRRALDMVGLPPAALPRLRATMASMIDEMIDVLDALDAADEDLEDGHDAEMIDEDGEDPEGDDLDHGEADKADDEPYLSVVEWKEDGDNWRRSGRLTDVEDDDEEGGEHDPYWWERSAHPLLEVAHV